MQNCLQLNASERPTASALLKNDYFTRDNFSSLFIEELKKLIEAETELTNSTIKGLNLDLKSKVQFHKVHQLNAGLAVNVHSKLDRVYLNTLKKDKIIMPQIRQNVFQIELNDLNTNEFGNKNNATNLLKTQLSNEVIFLK